MLFRSYKLKYGEIELLIGGERICKKGVLGWSRKEAQALVLGILSLTKLAKLSNDEAVKTNILVWRSEKGFKLLI